MWRAGKQELSNLKSPPVKGWEGPPCSVTVFCSHESLAVLAAMQLED